MFGRRTTDRPVAARPRRCQYCGEAITVSPTELRARAYCNDRCEADLYVLTARSI